MEKKNANGFGLAVAAFLLMVVCAFVLLYDEQKDNNLPAYMAILAILIDLGTLCIKQAKTKLYFYYDPKRFAKGVLQTVAVTALIYVSFYALDDVYREEMRQSLFGAEKSQLFLLALFMAMPYLVKSYVSETAPACQTQPTAAAPRSAPTTPQSGPFAAQGVPKTQPAPQNTDPRRLVYCVMVEMFGQNAVFPDALIGRDTTQQADFLVRAPGCANAVFFIVRNQSEYQRATKAAEIWGARGAYWFIVYEKDCQDPAYIRQWLLSAIKRCEK